MKEKTKKPLIIVICSVIVLIIAIVMSIVIVKSQAQKREDKIKSLVLNEKVTESANIKYQDIFNYFDQRPTYIYCKYDDLPSDTYINTYLDLDNIVYEQTEYDVPKGKNIYYFKVWTSAKDDSMTCGYFMQKFYFAVDLKENKVTYIGREFGDLNDMEYEKFNNYPSNLAVALDYYKNNK